MSFFADYNFFYSLGEFDYLAEHPGIFARRIAGKYKDDLVYVKSTETGKKYPIGIKVRKKCLGEGNRLVSGYLCGRPGRWLKKQRPGREVYRRKILEE